MKPIFFSPHKALQDFISHFMIVDIKIDEPYSQKIPFPPTPQHSIHFYPGDPIRTCSTDNKFTYSPESVIVGPQVSRVNLSIGKNHRLLSVAFRPGGLYRLLKMPMYELYDRPYDAEQVLGPAVKEINERLRAAKGYLEMKTVVENYLLKKIGPFVLSGFERSARLMLSAPTSQTIEQAANLSCLSLRQFERKSREMMGYSPKFFQRLIRFPQAYRLKVSDPYLSWTQICYTTGYYDQMHLIRDFKEFAGANPEILAKEILQSPVQVQDHLKI
jgi:AraC-like DNA-binding protein